MKYILRPVISAILSMALVAALPAQSRLSHMMHELNPLLHSSQGYLGVLVGDVDGETATKLKLKDLRGAVVTLVDHDAPAGPVLHVNDVVLRVNGQVVEGAEQFGRMLREIPAGHKVTLDVSRDGSLQTITVELCDRKAMEQNVWNKMNKGDGFPPPSTGMGILPGGGDGVSGMHMPLFTSSLHVGAVIEPLTGQMADYLGVTNGVMVKHVDRKSEAEAAGLKEFDVILKVGSEPIKTTADWDRALRSNEGKSVQVTILRARKQQTVTLQVDSKRKGSMEWKHVLPEGELPELAQLDQDFDAQFAEQMKQFNEQLKPDQIEELRRQAEQLRRGLMSGALMLPEMKIDPKQMEELQKQMEEFGKNFSIEQFKIDPKQMEEMQREMEQWQKSFPAIPCQPGHFIRYEEAPVESSRPA